MSMKEQINNLVTIAKSDRRVMFFGGFTIFALILWSLMPGQAARNVPRQTQTQQVASQQTLGGEEAFRDLVNSLGQRVDKVAGVVTEQQKSLERTTNDYQRDRKQFQGIFESVADRLDQVDKSISTLENKIQDISTQAAPAPVDSAGNAVASNSGPESLWFNEATVPKPVEPPKPLRMTFISPGDTVQVKLLTGVNAPVDGTPYPVLFQIKGPISGPDGSSLDVGEARLIAAATGSETDSRVIYRLSDLAIRHKDGRRSVVKVDGWVVGEDGIRGTSGRLVDKLGRLILATAGVSFASAFGDRLTDKANGLQIENSDNVTVDAQDMDFAGVSAFSDASNRLGKVLLDRYEKLVPVVEVLSGREVAAVFSAPAEVEMLEEEEDGVNSAALD